MMIAGRPVVDSAGNIYVRGELLGFRGAKTQLFCLDPELRLKWHRQLPPGGSEPRIDEGKCLVYVGCEGGKFVGLDKSTGKVLEERTVAQVSRGDIQLGDHVMIRTGAGTFLLDAVKTKAAARIHRLSLKGEQCGVWPA
jgi:outer membrane protein assembly factor BamB